MIGLLRQVYAIARPSGRKRLAAVLAIVVVQAVMQTLAVFSLLPLLAAASDPTRFRTSRAGSLFVEVVGGGSDRRVLLFAGGIALGVLILGNLVSLAAEYARMRYAFSIAHQLRVQLLGQLLERRYEYFANSNTSVLLKHLVDDTSVVAGELVGPALDLVARVLLIVLLVALVVFVEPAIVLGGAVVVVLYFMLVMRPVRRRAERTSEELKHQIRALYTEVNQTLNAAKPVMAAGRSRYFVARAERVSKTTAEILPRLPMFAAIPRSGLEIIVFGGMIIWVLAALAAGGNLLTLVPRIGLVAVVAYRLMPSVQLLFAHMGTMSAARQALDEVSDLIREQEAWSALPSQPAAEAAAAPLHWQREIRFENVSFAYAGTSEPTLENIDLSVGKGQRVAIVGPTGSGKSTLIDLFLGLLLPTSGRILVDGQPLTAEIMPEWRMAIGYVPQELFLIDASIAENISFGFDSDAPNMQHVREVADIAQASEFIEDGRAQGFGSVVGERGVRLSGGQRQRLALARALYSHPSTLVLDEATSALDPQTEQKVVSALADAHEQLTIVTVTHRLSTVTDYDCIYYVENGRIVAAGDFTSLVDAHPSFRRFAH